MFNTQYTTHNLFTSQNPRKYLSTIGNRNPTLRHKFMEGVFDPNLVKYGGPTYPKVDPKETFKEILDVADQNKHQYYLRHVLHVFEPSLGPKYVPKKIEGIYGDNEDHKLKMLALTAIPKFFDDDKEIFRKAILHLKQTTKSGGENSIIDDDLAKKHFVECLCASSQVSTGKKTSDVSFIHDHKEQKILNEYKEGYFSDPALKQYLKFGETAAQELINLERTNPAQYIKRADQLKKDKKCMVQYGDEWNRDQIGTVFGDGSMVGPTQTVQSDVVLTKVVSIENKKEQEQEEFCFRLDVFVDIITGMEKDIFEEGISNNNIQPFVQLAISKISSPVSPEQTVKLKQLINEKMHIKHDAKWFEKQVSYNNAFGIIGECRLEKAIATLNSKQVNNKFTKFVEDLKEEVKSVEGAPQYLFKDKIKDSESLVSYLLNLGNPPINVQSIDLTNKLPVSNTTNTTNTQPGPDHPNPDQRSNGGGGLYSFFSKPLGEQEKESNEKIKSLEDDIEKMKITVQDAEIEFNAEKDRFDSSSTRQQKIEVDDAERRWHAAIRELKELEKKLADENVNNATINLKKVNSNYDKLQKQHKQASDGKSIANKYINNHSQLQADFTKAGDDKSAAENALANAKSNAIEANEELNKAKQNYEAKDDDLLKKFKSEHRGSPELYYYSFLTQDDKYPIAPTLLRGPQCATKIVPTLMSGVYENIVQCDENGLIDVDEEFNFTKEKPIVNKFMHRRISEFGHFPHELEGEDHYLVEERKLNELQIRELKKYPRKYDNKGTLEERPTDIFYPYPFEILISNITQKIEENKQLLQELSEQKIQGDKIIKQLYDFSKFQQPFLIPPNQKFIAKGITIENSSQIIPHGMIFAGYDNNISNVTDRMGRYLRAMKELVGQCLFVNESNGIFLNKKKFETEFIQKINDNKDSFKERVWLLPGIGFVGEDTGERKDVKQWNPDANCFDFEKYTYTYLPQSAGKRKTRKHKRRTQKKQKKNKKTTRHLKKRSRRNH